jgi:hypothetical protein
MRKAFGIVIGCILLCGAVMAALLATPPPAATVTVTISGKVDTKGVDMPWFDLSKGKHETVSWKNESGKDCMIMYHGESPFDPKNNPIGIANGQTSDPKEPTNTREPTEDEKKHPDKVYKSYEYTVACPGLATFDPGNGVRP